ALARAATWPALRWLRIAVAMVGRRTRHLLAHGLGLLCRAGGWLARARARRTRDARCAVVPERAAELRRTRLSQCHGVQAGDRGARRSGRARSLLAGAAGPGW